MIYVDILSIIIVLGSVGNIFSIVIWKYGKRSKTTNCKTYMWSLAVNDLFILLVIGTEYAIYVNGIELRVKHDIICKFVCFFGMFSPQLSAWITVLIAMERMLYVIAPLQMFQTNAKRRSIIAIVSIILFSFSLNVNVLFTASVNVYSENSTVSSCVLNAMDDYTSKILNAVSYGIFTFLLPLLIITVSNVITLVTICTRKKIAQGGTRQERNIRNITRVVISISIMHCISTFPYATFMYSQYSLSFASSQFYQFIITSYFLNSGINFVLYCLFGDYFRQDLKETIMS
ncbi:mu-type opioid receptor-like [Ruditapes philippinarum]|uniref:mu-type opioid receptor-like n=1 Tax=Ruditapes philippinarum TaxID=129788 RepID=UPI00295A9529|nr:mu-type opioid receptor-like [Ruditapes philippinarum]